jgi:aldehyde:ferredoxin oxidoreductase
MERYGYHGIILHIDLTRKTTRIETSDDIFWRTYAGGGLLATYYLLTSTNPGLDAFSPDNLLIFTTSVCAGQPYPGLARFTTAAKSPLTGGIGETRTEGPFAMAIKQAGVDAIIISGRAEHPITLLIENSQVQFADASTLWGSTVPDCVDQLEKKYGRHIHSAVIGPAGENMVRYASIVSDRNFQASRMGMGAVMGSKHLKAIVLQGEDLPDVHDEQTCGQILGTYSRQMIANPLTNWQLKPPGFACWVHTHGIDTALCTRNYSASVFEGAEQYTPDIYMRYYRGYHACPGCPNQCIKSFTLEKLAKGERRSGGMHQEASGSLGPNCGISNLETVITANELCNQYGLDPTSLGFTISMAMDWDKNGIRTLHTDAGPLQFGADSALLAMMTAIAHRKGDGNLLAEGTKRAAEKIGGKAEFYAMHVKGQEMVPFEPRSQTNLAMGYATAPIGPRYDICEHDWDYDTEAGWPHTLDGSRAVGILERIPMEYQGIEKVRNFKALSTLWSAADVLDMCIFAIAPTRVLNLEMMAQLLGAVTGWKTSSFEIMRLGERRLHLMRLYNLREGLGASDDTLPERFFTEGLDCGGKLAGAKLDREIFSNMIGTYYEMMGWDKQGRPHQATLLDHHINQLY